MGRYTYDEERQTWGRPRMGEDPRGLQKKRPMMGAGFSSATAGGTDDRMREAQTKAAEDAVFNQNQNEFAQRFGRGLTDGGASTRGGAGNRVQVPAGAMAGGLQQKNESYFNQDNIASAGNINRAMSEYQKAIESEDQELITKTGNNLMKSINDSPMSSQTKIAGMSYDPEQGYQFFGEDGKSPTHKGFVTQEDIMNIGKRNEMYGPTVNQRQAGTGQGGGMQQGGRPSMTKDSAKTGAENRYKTEADKYKKMFDAKDEITGKSAYTKDELTEQYNKVLGAERDAQQMMQSAGGLGAGQGGVRTPQQAYEMAQGLLDDGNNPQEVLDYMWKQGLDRNTMDILSNQLLTGGQGGQTGQGGGMGMQQPQQGQPQDVPVTGPGGSGLGLPAPAQAQQAKQPSAKIGGLTKIKAKLAAQEKAKVAKAEQKMANKVFDKKYKALREKIYSNNAGTKEIEALYETATPKQMKTLERLYEMAARKEARN